MKCLTITFNDSSTESRMFSSNEKALNYLNSLDNQTIKAFSLQERKVKKDFLGYDLGGDKILQCQAVNNEKGYIKEVKLSLFIKGRFAGTFNQPVEYVKVGASKKASFFFMEILLLSDRKEMDFPVIKEA